MALDKSLHKSAMLLNVSLLLNEDHLYCAEIRWAGGPDLSNLPGNVLIVEAKALYHKQKTKQYHKQKRQM